MLGDASLQIECVFKDEAVISRPVRFVVSYVEIMKKSVSD